MAKQRQTASGRVRKAKAARSTSASGTRLAVRSRSAVKPGRGARSRPRTPSGPPDPRARVPKRAVRVPAAPPERTPHIEAMEVYERGVSALQQKRYAEASKLLQTVIDAYPDEKELHERAQVYLNICRRQAVPLDATPKTFEERVYAATLAINAGAYDEGLARLGELAAESPDDDHVQFMLAIAHSLKGDLASAWPRLQRAVDLNDENRLLARQDADLEALRCEPQFRQIVDRLPSSGRRERRSGRGRVAR